jgi:hypothetical protein
MLAGHPCALAGHPTLWEGLAGGGHPSGPILWFPAQQPLGHPAGFIAPAAIRHDACTTGHNQEMASHKHLQIIAVHDDEIRFDDDRPEAMQSTSATLGLADFLAGRPFAALPAAEAGPRGVRLLIVPDHWLGQAAYAFQSRKRSLVEAFTQRQLLAAHPELPSIAAFYAYRFTRGEDENQRLTVTYLQEPKGYQLYQRLEDSGFPPHLITTPALLWEYALRSSLAGFADGGQCLIQVVGRRCFFYFFVAGWFLFSRAITLPDGASGPDDRFGVLVYELNQSFYLFAQKARADVAGIHLVAPHAEDPALLTDLLGREVRPLVQGEAVYAPRDSDSPIAGFMAQARHLRSGFRGIAHRQLKRELDWKPVQIAAAVVGAVTLLVVAAESLFLRGFYAKGAGRDLPGVVSDASAAETLAAFSDALAFISAEASKPSAAEAVAVVMRSLPAATRIKTLALAIAEQPGLRLEGVITASGHEAFEVQLTALLERLSHGFALRPPLGLQDVVCHPAESGTDAAAADGQSAYDFRLEFGLP